MRSSFALPLVLSLVTSLSSAAPQAPQGIILRPTLVAGSAEPVANLMRAGADGAEWAFPGGSTLIAEPGAELRVIAKPQDLDLGSKGQVAGYTVLLKQGFVRARVSDQAKSAIVIAGPKRTSVLVASGEASLHAGQKIAVANVRGTASVSTDGNSFRGLPPGMVEVVDDAGPRRRALLAAPKAMRGTLLLLSPGSKVALGELGWDTVPGATGYRLEVRDANSERLHLRTSTVEAVLAPGAAELAAGTYRVRVVPIDASGMEVGSPLERGLRVASVTLPAGGYFDDGGSLRIPAGSRVGLGQASGLEVADGLGESFQPAPSALALPGTEPRLFRLRSQGSGENRTLWLLPRKARAHVEFAPQAPRWPEQPLEIRVRIEDENGVSAPWVDARPKVRVGVDPVDVAFAHEGSWLKGTLPARTGNGPWVVRVEVSDQNGAELGRDFVEVAVR
jgi:hypothetical protein